MRSDHTNAAGLVGLLTAVALTACGASLNGGGARSTTTRTPSTSAASTPAPTPTPLAAALPAPTQCTRTVTATERTDSLPAPRLASSAVRARIPTPSAPQGFASDARSLWVVTHRTTVVYRIDPTTNHTVAINYTTNTPDSGAFDVSSGPDGVFAAIGNDDVVDRVDTAANTIGPFATIRGAEWVTDTAQGLWVASTSENGQLVSKVDPSTGQVVKSVAIGGAGILATDALMMTYAAGSLWVATQDRPILVRIDPSTSRVIAVVVLPAVAVSLAGTASAVYAGMGDVNGVGRVDATTNCLTAVTTFGPRPANARDFVLVPVDVDSARVRVTYGSGAFASLDPSTLAVLHTFRVDDQDFEGGMTAAFGSLWFSTFNHDAIERLDVVDGR